MPRIRYKVTLEEPERQMLKEITTRGRHSSQKVLNALILLKCDEGRFQDRKLTNQAIADVLPVSLKKIDRVKRRLVEQGLEGALDKRKPERTYRRKADGDFEAHLIAVSCGKPPPGHARWSLRLLADRMVELEYVDAVSYETVRRVLKKNELKPWKKQQWVIPPKQNGEFVARMEQVLDVYKRPYDPRHPVVCMDESPRQLIRETRLPLAAGPGAPARHDFEYERCGVCNVFMAVEPLASKRTVQIRERRTKTDWAHFLNDMARPYPCAEKITLVMDNLNTHGPGSLYETFEPDVAKALWDRFEFVYTPKHGSWLNMAEIELNVLIKQCLDRRIDNLDQIQAEVGAWQKRRNNAKSRIDWQFTSPDARTKLKRLYPTLNV